ncbi:MAG: Na+/H+ antiporter NhaA, partial [Deltaproteobacteria bacterium]|nr:Na+/H+ antiporter NhaA [Deltaproteobacteria bacterium]MBW2172330.1 Na+/H+ antiporter NhaA [Deltaproteobacteria bacterium]
VQTPVQRLEHGLYSWIAYLILPLFALANAGFTLEGMNISHAIGHSVTLGIILGLVVGKPLGIILFTYLAYKILKTPLPSGVTWSHIIGASILGGIGFTMSLFISSLSFTSHEFIGYSKLGILVGSVISGVLGLIVLRLRTTPQTETL